MHTPYEHVKLTFKFHNLIYKLLRIAEQQLIEFYICSMHHAVSSWNVQYEYTYISVTES